MSIEEIRKKLRLLGDEQKAIFHQRFFKTGPGEYGEGDIFIGIRVPDLRNLAKSYNSLPVADALRILKSPIHEERLFALLVLVRSFEKGDEPVRRQIYDGYLGHTKHVNNWDLVDLSAPNIVGAHLMDKSRKPLYVMAKSKSLWERRIAIISTLHFIRKNEFEDTIKISKLLVNDKEDLMHKAVGWMLREVGKRDLAEEEKFLREHYRAMPRTMLRYAIEKFPESKRQMYLKG